MLIFFDQDNIAFLRVIARGEQNDVAFEQAALKPGAVDHHAFIIGFGNVEDAHENIVIVGVDSLAAFLVRRRGAAAGSPMRTIDAALRAAQGNEEPVSLITVSLGANGATPRRLAPVLRSRLRHSDRLCRLDAQRFVVVAPDTDLQTAEALAADLRRHLERSEQVTAGVEIDVHEADATASGAELLERIRAETRPARAPSPTG